MRLQDATRLADLRPWPADIAVKREAQSVGEACGCRGAVAVCGMIGVGSS
ncbi:hypothetical protein ACFFQF_06080 [Haladaptatus pallidirubidus]|nr:hypothetical protein [Haladaptatus pallidirubidus]